MAPEEVIELCDSYWSEQRIFTKKQPSSPPTTNPLPQIHEESKLSHVPTLHVRSLNDWLLSCETSCRSGSSSPNSVILTPKLQAILSVSGKEVKREEEIEPPTKKKVTDHIRRRRRTKKSSSSKSLSELEFKELKGFMDLGFVFSKEDKDSGLVSIIPGLQRLGRKAGGHEDVNHDHEYAVSRPYLSEAWGVLDQRKVNNPLMNWRIPALHSDIDMKDHLRVWAQTVASTVR